MSRFPLRIPLRALRPRHYAAPRGRRVRHTLVLPTPAAVLLAVPILLFGAARGRLTVEVDGLLTSITWWA